MGIQRLGGGSSVWEAKTWEMLAETVALLADRENMTHGAAEPFADAGDVTLVNATVSGGAAAPVMPSVYAAVYGGDIYKQTNGTGNFVALGQTTRNWRGMAVAPNGDVYATVYVGDIYKQTGGTGSFAALGQSTLEWDGVAATASGDIYAAAVGVDIHKQTGGTGNFVALGQGTRSWRGVAAAPNGDIYATVYGGDIYKQTGGSGDFVALNQTSRNWRAIAVAPNGDVYAAVVGGDIYKQTGGTGSFVELNQTARNWSGICVTPFGDVYAEAQDGDIYKQTRGSGDFIALGQTARTWNGIAVIGVWPLAVITLNPINVSGATAGKIVFRASNEEAAAVLDVVNDLGVYPMIGGSQGAKLEFTSEDLGSNNFRFTSNDFALSDGTFGVRFASLRARNFRIYDTYIIWR